MTTTNSLSDIGLESRNEVLLRSLHVEEMVSVFLAQMLGVQDAKNSKSFGNTGSSLSFSAKVNLLIDIGALQGKDRKKFHWFMEVRNQFMHNIAASSFESCFSFLEPTKNALLKEYKQLAGLSNEQKLRLAFV